jgi:hypothetical protein
MFLKIHGDNIIECERALELVSLAYEATARRKTNNLFFPTFEVIKDGKIIFEVSLLAGHGRWNVGIADVLARFGAPIREATDAYITKIIDEEQQTEQLLLAIEFCSALPAGNNAWQRSGRAITCAEIGVPYLYFAEVGGVELDASRQVKAPRFPNPIVPFSYLAATRSLDTVCVPIYESHPAITSGLRERFSEAFGLADSLKLIKAILNQEATAEPLQSLIEKGTALVEILTAARKTRDTLHGEEWENFRQLHTGLEKADFLENDLEELIWRRKSGEKVRLTPSFRRLIAEVQNLDCLAVGAKGIPICLVPASKVQALIEIFETIYTPEGVADFTSRLNAERPLLIVWITGFKPKGDDARPDRGLVPLARMLFGNDIDLLTIVSGPATPGTWRLFRENLARLVLLNGLWQAIYNLSDFVFVDSATSEAGAMFTVTDRNLERRREKVTFTSANAPRSFTEHDTDTAIHQLFSRQDAAGIFESMCNPPGGDWSGVSVQVNQNFHRWTSLPRVSAIGGKRPDHVIQFVADEPTFLAIESKNNAADLDADIGTRLVQYVQDLFSSAPTATKTAGNDWELSSETVTPLIKYNVFSGGAFCYRNDAEIAFEMERGELDFVMAFEFSNDGTTRLHLKLSEQCSFLRDVLMQIANQFSGGLKVQIH